MTFLTWKLLDGNVANFYNGPPMKKRLALILNLLLIAGFSTVHAGQAIEMPHRGLFVSVIQDPETLSSRNEIDKLISFAKETKIDTLFVQIYRANKSWFPSALSDVTPYETCKKNVGEDPFALLIRKAHAEGIQVHAWMNLLSLGGNPDAPLLKKYGPSILTQKPGPEKKTIEDYKIDNQYFLEPGDSRVRAALSILIEEVLKTYPDLDGLQMDYIRYPDSKPFYGYTPENIQRFRAAKGEKAALEESNPEWKDWRRDQVTEVVKLLAAKARALKPEIQVSTTGCAPYARAFHEAFQDWASWLDRGLIDFVTMMSYPPDVPTFEKYVTSVQHKPRDFHKVNIAVGAYKLGQVPETFAKQFEFCERAGGRGCVLFHYGSFVDYPALEKTLVLPAKHDAAK